MLSNPQLISGISPAPDISTSMPKIGGDVAVAPPAAPKSKLDDLLKGRAWLIALGGGLVGILVLVTTVIVVASGHPDPKNDHDADVTTAEGGGATAVTSTDERVAAAIAEIDKGNFGAGIKQLGDMGKEVEGREDVHRALFKAYAATDRPEDAMREAALVFHTSPSPDFSGKDKPLRIEIRNTAVQEGTPSASKSAVDLAFSLMQKDMGTVGWDDLYDVAYGQSGVSYPKAAQRAQREIIRGDRHKMTPELAITVDLHSVSGSCVAIKGLLDRASERGDERTLALLRQFVPPRFVGHWKKQDALGCIHGTDKLLDKTIGELEARLKHR
jgi:hypothetical protein